MGVYDRPIATAARLIKKYGQVCQWSRLTDGDGGDTPWEPGAQTVVTSDVDIVFIATSGKNLLRSFAGFMAGSETPLGDCDAIMPGNVGFIPSLKDSIKRGGKTYQPETLDPVAPGGVPIIYKIWFKK